MQTLVFSLSPQLERWEAQAATIPDTLESQNELDKRGLSNQMFQLSMSVYTLIFSGLFKIMLVYYFLASMGW